MSKPSNGTLTLETKEAKADDCELASARISAAVTCVQ